LSGRIYIAGSSNTDMVVRGKRLPDSGETLLGGDFLCTPGGKGANQAVAAARLGGKVSMIARLGMDSWGENALATMKAVGIDTRGVTRDPHTASGVAVIMVDCDGQNMIYVAPGANSLLSPEHLNLLESEITADDCLLLQLEIPLDTVGAAIELAHQKGARVVLDPAPAVDPQDVRSWLPRVHVCKPNQSECRQLTGVEVTDRISAIQAYDALGTDAPAWLLVTLGADGAIAVGNETAIEIPAHELQPVDATAAGDCFSGALAVMLAENRDMRSAMEFANRAAALSTLTAGAQASMPLRQQVDALMDT
jgi:ribokinase